MRDFMTINVYLMNQFELVSKQRETRFRFIKYNGKNYQEVCDYIHELSPNTKIWEEKLLKSGELYTFSGRTFAFINVPKWNIRCCIANNPYIVIDGKEQPLVLTQEEAESYLHLTGGSVFCYDNICCDYSYDAAKDRFIVYDKNHPRGLSTKNLENHKEWYIGGEDGLQNMDFSFTPQYQNDTHTVHLDYDLKDIVERIQNTIFKINKTTRERSNYEIFVPSYEDFKRYKTLSSKCHDSLAIEQFVKVLYNILYESTKTGYANRAKIPEKLKYDKFVEIVGEYRNHFSHGNAEYDAGEKITIDKIYLRYLHTNNEPQNATDFETIQIEMLKDMEVFLNRVLDVVLNNVVVNDYISYDPTTETVFCNNVKLPSEFVKFKGCKCKIDSVRNNNRPSDKLIYYSFRVSSIELSNKSGIIQTDANGNCSCNGIIIPKHYSKYKGSKVEIYRINAYLSQGTLYESALSFSIALPKPIIGDLLYENERPVVKGFYLDPKKWSNYNDDYKIELRTIMCTADENDAENIQEIVDGFVSEGPVTKVKMNLYVCGNVLLRKSIARKLVGQRVRIENPILNSDKYTSKKYPYYVGFIKVIDSTITKKKHKHSATAENENNTRPIGEILKELGRTIVSKFRFRKKSKSSE